MQAMNVLRKKEVQPKWTKEMFEAMTEKELRAVLNSGGALKGFPAAYVDKFSELGFNRGDMDLAVLVHSQQRKVKLDHVRPVLAVNTVGGRVEYTPTSVTIISPSGEERQATNAPIPLPFSQKVRPNIVAVTAFCAQLVEVKKAEVQNAVRLVAWQTAYANSPLNVPGCYDVAETLVELIKCSKQWTALTVSKRTGLSGLEWVDFVRTVLDSMEDEPYYFLNTKIVVRALNAFVKKEVAKGYKWVIHKTKDVATVPASAYKPIYFPPMNRDIEEGTFPNVYLFLGPIKFGPILPSASETFEAVEKIKQRVNELGMVSRSVSALMAQMKDFSGVGDSFGRRVTFLVAAALMCWRENRVPTIQLHSIGDLPILVSSLNYWNEQIAHAKFEGWEVAKRDFFFLLKSRTEWNYVPAGLKSRIVEVKHEKSVLICWTEKAQPKDDGMEDKVERQKDVQDGSLVLLPEYRRGDYIVCAPIWGYQCFPRDLAVQTANKSRLNALNLEMFGDPYVFKFGSAYNYRGVITSLSNFYLVGFGEPLVKEEKYGPQVVIYPKVTSLASWYKRVHADYVIVALSWLNPVQRYSPISNVVRQSSRAITMVQALNVAEDGIPMGEIRIISPSTTTKELDEEVARYVDAETARMQQEAQVSKEKPESAERGKPSSQQDEDVDDDACFEVPEKNDNEVETEEGDEDEVKQLTTPDSF